MRPLIQNRQLALSVAAAVAAVLIVVLLLRGDDSESPSPSPSSSAAFSARPATERDLSQLARELDFPIYWLGPSGEPGENYELTHTPSGRVYIRYIGDAGARTGPRRTVATYPLRNGYVALQEAAKRSGHRLRELPDGGSMLAPPGAPRSVLVGYRGATYQVEVFDPVPGRARQLVAAGELRPVPR